MGILLDFINVNEIARFIFMGEFALLAFLSLTGIFKMIHHDYEIRRNYGERLHIFNVFFSTYKAEEERLDKAREEKEIKRKALEEEMAARPLITLSEPEPIPEEYDID